MSKPQKLNSAGKVATIHKMLSKIQTRLPIGSRR
jgi:hypothetical protein